MKDHGSRKSRKVKGGTNALENFRAVRVETYGAETQLSPTTTPIDAIYASVQFPTLHAILTS
jgi:hypothetical protein